MVDYMIKPIDRELLIKWGFEYDLAFWTHPSYLFKLQSIESGYRVLVPTDINESKSFDISSNGQLLQLIAVESNRLIEEKLKDSKFLNKDAQLKFIVDTIHDIFSFDDRLAFQLQVTPMGLQLTPNNEYTYTLLRGIECTFRVTLLKDENVKFDSFSAAPECVSYRYLKTLYPDYVVNLVEIQLTDDNWEPFFGVGINIVDKK